MIQAPEVDRFSISALAGIVGVPVETLRTWERRYGVPESQREKGGRRQYTLTEVERLRAIVQLVHLGDRVKDLAHLDAAALGERLRLHGGVAESAAPSASVRLVIVHPSPPAGLVGPGPSPRAALEIVASVTTADALDPGLNADAVLIHASALGEAPAATLDALEERLDPDAIVVLASYLSGPLRRMQELRGVRVVDEDARVESLRARVEDAVLAARLCAGGRSPAAPAPSPLARFTRPQLERLLNSPNTVACECPAHLSGLILRLREFERFSLACANDTPEQAELHGALGSGSAEAAHILELLLERVCAHDGIDPRA